MLGVSNLKNYKFLYRIIPKFTDILFFFCKDQREQKRNEYTKRSQDLDAAFNE